MSVNITRLVSVSLIFSLFVVSITLPSTAALLHQSWVFRERGGAEAARERARLRSRPNLSALVAIVC